MTDVVPALNVPCPMCGALVGRYCDSEARWYHAARDRTAREDAIGRAAREDTIDRTTKTSPVFQQDGEFIRGAGVSLFAPEGYTIMDAALLNRLVDLVAEWRRLGDDDGMRIARDRARIEAAKADLTEELGLERKDPDDRAAHEEAIRRAAARRVPTRDEDDE